MIPVSSPAGRAALQAARQAGKPSKYRSVKTTVDGVQFASKKEAQRFAELLLLQKAAQIRDLRVQPRFQLFAAVPWGPNVYVGEYVADFSYIDAARQRVVEDVKSPATRTPLYKLKKKLAEACHGITITEIS